MAITITSAGTYTVVEGETYIIDPSVSGDVKFEAASGATAPVDFTVEVNESGNAQKIEVKDEELSPTVNIADGVYIPDLDLALSYADSTEVNIGDNTTLDKIELSKTGLNELNIGDGNTICGEVKGGDNVDTVTIGSGNTFQKTVDLNKGADEMTIGDDNFFLDKVTTGDGADIVNAGDNNLFTDLKTDGDSDIVTLGTLNYNAGDGDIVIDGKDHGNVPGDTLQFDPTGGNVAALEQELLDNGYILQADGKTWVAGADADYHIKWDVDGDDDDDVQINDWETIILSDGGPDPDGAVDGEAFGEVMELGYDDSNAPTDQGGDLITNDDDLIFGNGGGDTIDGAAGNDTIFGDSGTDGTPSHEIFEWDEAPNFGDDNPAANFTQNTGTANISFSISSSAGVTNQYETLDQNTDDLDPEVNENASFESVLNGDDNSGTYSWESDRELENVEFRVNDIDGDGRIIVRAYDADGNPIEVVLSNAGSGLSLSDTDGVPGNDTATSIDNNYTPDDAAEHSVLVTIPGPVSRWEIVHEQDGGNNTGINITDITFDVTGTFGEPGDDSISGNLGDDEIYGEAGEDTLDGGEGDDTLDGGADDDTIVGGDGSDVVTDDDGDNLIDTSGGSPLPDLGFPAYGPFPAVPADSDPNDDRDSVTTGDGNDTITTGDDADTISSGGGDDVISSGIDDDEIDAGEGDDEITSGEGNDTVLGGEGNDTIYGGLGPTVPDGANIPDAPGTGPFGPDPEPDNGDDLLDGGAGDDLIFGEDDDDTILGGDGDDTIDGGVDNDSMTGGDGDDVFFEVAGDGADTITDFNVGNSGSINDGDQTNNDFVDLSAFYNSTTVTAVNNVDADPTNDFGSALGMLRADAEDGRIDGVIDGTDYSAEIGDVDLTLKDGSGGAVTGTDLTFDNTNVACFVRGTLIATRRGSVAIEELAAGDEVITMDHGFQKIRWIGCTKVPARGHLAPVVIRKGAMGNERDLRVSPQHRMLVRGWHVELMFGKTEALVPAKALINDETVFALEGGEVEYFHMMFDRHELVYAEGIPSESFHPGHVGMGSFAEETREEILHLFPELREDAGAYTDMVRPALKVNEARLLAENPELLRD